MSKKLVSVLLIMIIMISFSTVVSAAPIETYPANTSVAVPLETFSALSVVYATVGSHVNLGISMSPQNATYYGVEFTGYDGNVVEVVNGSLRAVGPGTTSIVVRPLAAVGVYYNTYKTVKIVVSSNTTSINSTTDAYYPYYYYDYPYNYNYNYPYNYTDISGRYEYPYRYDLPYDYNYYYPDYYTSDPNYRGAPHYASRYPYYPSNPYAPTYIPVWSTYKPEPKKEQ